MSDESFVEKLKNIMKGKEEVRKNIVHEQKKGETMKRNSCC